MPIDNRKDILLLLLFSPGSSGQINEPITGRTRLVKMLFLFRKEIWKQFKGNIPLTEDNLYEFFPWNFGPFSSQIYDDITFFILRGFIEVTLVKDDVLTESAEEWNFWLRTNGDDAEISEYQEEEFRLSSPKGIDFAQGLYSSLSENQKKILFEFKTRIVSTPLRALLRYVYRQYPDQTEKSRIKNDITSN